MLSSVAVAQVTALVSVLASFGIALVSILSNTRSSRNQREQEFALSLMPRRLDAFETAWRALFDYESEGRLSDAGLDVLVSASLWLPSETSSEVLVIVRKQNALATEVRSLRNRIMVESGSQSLSEFIGRKER